MSISREVIIRAEMPSGELFSLRVCHCLKDATYTKATMSWIRHQFVFKRQ
jgi:hypothetical protein